jgi:hypothetical protein
MYMPRLWEEGLNIVLGIWVIVSPWVLGFSSFKGVTNNTVIVGILVAVFAALAIAHDREVKNMATGI